MTSLKKVFSPSSPFPYISLSPFPHLSPSLSLFLPPSLPTFLSTRPSCLLSCSNIRTYRLLVLRWPERKRKPLQRHRCSVKNLTGCVIGGMNCCVGLVITQCNFSFRFKIIKLNYISMPSGLQLFSVQWNLLFTDTLVPHCMEVF